MRSPSYRKKNIENSAMKKPATKWVMLAPIDPARLRIDESLGPMASLPLSIQDWSCASLIPSGPVRAQS